MRKFSRIAGAAAAVSLAAGLGAVSLAQAAAPDYSNYTLEQAIEMCKTEANNLLNADQLAEGIAGCEAATSQKNAANRVKIFARGETKFRGEKAAEAAAAEAAALADAKEACKRDAMLKFRDDVDTANEWFAKCDAATTSEEAVAVHRELLKAADPLRELRLQCLKYTSYAADSDQQREWAAECKAAKTEAELNELLDKFQAGPTTSPSVETSADPSVEPSVDTSVDPSVEPSVDTSVDPSVDPSVETSVDPSVDPSLLPGTNPSREPLECVAPGRYILLDRKTVTAGDWLWVTACGFDPEQLVKFELHSTPVALGSAYADVNGTVYFKAVIPANTTAEEHHIYAIGLDGKVVTTSPIIVLNAGGTTLPTTASSAPAATATKAPAVAVAAKKTALAKTGVEAGTLAGLAALVTLVGAGLVVSRRRA